MKRLFVLAPVVLALAGSGCATKSYARKQAATVNDRVSQVETHTNEQTAALSNKHQTDISRVDERITTTDNKANMAAATAQQALTGAEQANAGATQANASAAQAKQQGQENSMLISANSTGLKQLEAAQNYTLVETGNVTFKFDRSNLTDEARAALDLIARRVLSAPRSVIEVAGFTDKVGAKTYNLTLSEARAEAVTRYLVSQNVPLRSISMIGLGEEQTPEQLAEEVQGIDPNATPKEIQALARRVRIRLYVPGSTVQSAGGTDHSPAANQQ
jgi:outer membrane protein OmpA-like peptidoglycan-associated protein